MTEPKARFIDSKCKQLDVDARLLLEEVLKVAKVSRATKKEASDAIETLNKYQQDKSSVPSEVVGYNKDWRKS